MHTMFTGIKNLMCAITLRACYDTLRADTMTPHYTDTFGGRLAFLIEYAPAAHTTALLVRASQRGSEG